jgi:hypothetical protein
MRLRPAAALASLLLPACYGYFPPRAATPVPGRRVSLELTGTGAVMLGPTIGASATAIDGLLLPSPDSAFVVSVLVVRRRNGRDEDWKGERVTVPRTLVEQLTERHFSAGRTVLFSVGIAVAINAIHQAFGGPIDSRPGSGTGNTGTPR